MGRRTPSLSNQPINWQLVIDSLTIPERIILFRKNPHLFMADTTRSEEVARAWRTKLGRDETTSLEDRLGDLGIDESELPFVVGTVALDAAESLAHEPWMDVCAEVGGWRGRYGEDGLPEETFLTDDDEDERPCPFEHALVPWVDVATRQLIEKCPRVEDLLSKESIRREQRRLLTNLASFARFTFIQELESRRVGTYQGNDLLFGLLSKNPPRTVYIQLVRRLLGVDIDDGEGWMNRYPSLARLLGVRVVAWVRALVEFLERLESDRAMLASELNSGEDPGALVELSFGAGDSHNGGRSVAVCSFESGLKVVYKPRSGSVDVAFASVVDQINMSLESDLRVRVPRTLDRGTWCWAEFITPLPCSGTDDLRRYHRRIGALLMIIHLLQGNDFHLENIMAHGSHPIPIDLETVCVPENARVTNVSIDRATEIIDHSVLRTLLLPTVMGFQGENPRSMGAIHLQVDTPTMRKIKRLVHLNTDFQRWASIEDPAAETRPDSQPWTETGERLTTAEQQSETKKGYEAAYRSMQSRCEEFLGESSPLRGLDRAWVRVLNRATNIYARLLVESCLAENLVSGVDRWLHLERLGVVLSEDPNDDVRATGVELVGAESNALMDGDIAYFTTTGSGMRYWIIEPVTGEPVELPETSLKHSAVDSAAAQVTRMSDSDLALQLKFQSGAYRSAVLSLGKSLHTSPDDELTPVARSSRPLPDAVVHALEHIAENAIDSGRHLNWIDLQLSVETEQISTSPLDASLYGGRGGLALVFERAYRLFGERRWLDIACGAINFERNLSSSSSSAAQGLFTTPPSGLGGSRPGIVAAAWAIGRHEGYGHYREFARKIATSLSERTISKDVDYDIISGSAGYILLLLSLHQEEALPGIDPLVGRLTDHLVAHVCDVDGIGWRSNVSNLPLCGFGHGRAGIGLALLEAGRFLNRPEVRTMGLAALEAEHRLRSDSPDTGWPDYRQLKVDERHKATYSINAWCSGSEGIALSRAAALQISDSPFLRDDLDFALASIQSIRSRREHLCCGRSGRILAHQALRRLHAGATFSADSTDHGVMAASLESSLGPGNQVIGVGLFQGLAGVVWAGMSLLEDDGSALLLLRP